MTRSYTRTDETGPLWAVFGAPLVGVPLMVVLLALGSGSTVDQAGANDVGYGVEQPDAPAVDHEGDPDALPSD